MLLAVLAFQAGLDLGTDSDTIASLAGGDFAPYAEDLSNDFMANADGGCWEITPSTGYEMYLYLQVRSRVENKEVNRFESLLAPTYITATDPTTLALDIDIMVLEDFRSELLIVRRC